MLYQDMLLKLEYHRNNIIKSFIKQGYFTKKEEINNKLTLIDERIALFKSYKFQPGELFNHKELNHNLEMLYRDIAFLYKIIEKINLEKYNKMLLSLEAHMVNLETLAQHFKKRANEEVKGTSLGKTLLFKTSDWEIEVKDESLEVFVGTLDLTQGSKISCFANINNTDKRNILFKFKAEDSSDNFNALPYNYNNDTYLVPGEITVNEEKLVMPDNFNINSEIVIPYDVNTKNDYKILSGENKIVLTDKETGAISVKDFPTVENPLVVKSNSFISFFIENTGTLEYNFNKKPFHTNFSIQDGTIQIDKDIQKVFLDVEEGFICYFNLDDDMNVWAIKEDAIVDNKSLIYDGMMLTRDFKIKEYVKDKTTRYNIYVSITEMDNDEVIDSIYIKEVD